MRRANINAPEFVRGRISALLQFRDLCLGFAQILEHVGAEILIELEDLQLGLGDFAARTGDIGNQLTALPLQPRLVPLQLHVTLVRYEILLIEFGDADKLLADVLDFAVLRLLLGGEAADFFADLSGPFAQLRALTLASLAARLKQPFFSGDRGIGGSSRRSGAHCLREGDVLKPVSFGEEPSLSRNVKIKL